MFLLKAALIILVFIRWVRFTICERKALNGKRFWENKLFEGAGRVATTSLQKEINLPPRFTKWLKRTKENTGSFVF
jgi:hypothetical protein